MTDSDPEADLDALARDYLDAWQRHLAEMAREAELPAVIGRLYARAANDPAAMTQGFDSWADAWRKTIQRMPGEGPKEPGNGD